MQYSDNINKHDVKKGYPHAGKPEGPYALCDCKTNIAFSPFFIVRQPSSQPIVKILGQTILGRTCSWMGSGQQQQAQVLLAT